MKKEPLLDKFNSIYNDTYQNILKYIILHCNNLEDVNDLIQETYFSFYKSLKKGNIKDLNKSLNYLIGIANNVLKSHYRFKKKQSLIVYCEDASNYENNTSFDETLENQIISKDNYETIWIFLKSKHIKIARIFYLHYVLGLTIKEISINLNEKESNIKNYLYRTLNELKTFIEKEGDNHDK